MFDIEDIHSLTGFLRDHKAHLERLRATGRPEILTVNGRAKVVVQDATAYQKMMQVIDAIDAEHVLRERLASLERGDPGTPMEEVLADVRATLGIDRTKLQ